MAKARLSTAEIRRLHEVEHLSIIEIAARAGISATAVRNRLDPRANRRAAREYYMAFEQHERERKSADAAAAQAESLKTAAIHGPWKQWELNYLAERGPYDTALQIAQALSRTYFAVTSAAKRYGIPMRTE